MLIRFNVKNFMSFSSSEDGKSEEFSMIAGKVRNKMQHIYDDGKIKLLKFSAIYGANASGKSNLVKAMDFMRRTVMNGLPEGHTDKYCKVDISNKDRESYFEFEVMIDGKYYSYGFEVILSQSKFVSEWLIELNCNSEGKVIFERDIDKGTFNCGSVLKSSGLREKINVYAEDIKNDDSALFLNIMNKNKKNLYDEYKNAVVLKQVYSWIMYDLDINYPDRPISDYSYMAKAENVQKICEMISAFGTGITGVEMVEVSPDKVLINLPTFVRNDIIKALESKNTDIKDNKVTYNGRGIIMRSQNDYFILNIDDDLNVTCKTIRFSHNKNDILFNFNEESDGTVRILDLLEILIAGEGKTYVVDELDRCLHPSLTYKFIKTFLEFAANKNIQLVVTTHESRLMDFELLRRDEIWFVNKRKSGESDIYSLEEYNERFDKKIDKAYLEGRYGGVPIFSSIFPLEDE